MPIGTYIFSLIYLLLAETACSQFTVYGDVYIISNNQLHIAFDKTYFYGGKIITDNTSTPEAVVSFGPQSEWEQLKKDSYVDGTVRIYHTATFTFPVGNENFFSPITLEVLKNSGFIQTKYTGTPPYLFTQLDPNFEIPDLRSGHGFHTFLYDYDSKAFTTVAAFDHFIL